VTAPEQAARLGTDPIVLDARFLADLAELSPSREIIRRKLINNQIFK
jgi:hypothetical protein